MQQAKRVVFMRSGDATCLWQRVIIYAPRLDIASTSWLVVKDVGQLLALVYENQ
jgi:hypothetical protein